MTTKTFRLSGNDIEQRWLVLDAADRPLGRLASEAAQLLLGKHKPTYEPHLAMGDYVIVINAGKVALTGQKTRDKVYYRHSGYPGALRERSYVEQMERDPARVVEKAIKGMLPHNVRGRELFRHLKVYAGAEHSHEAQLRAGTGERARKSAAKAAAAKPPTPAAIGAAPPADDREVLAGTPEDMAVPSTPATASPAVAAQAPTPASIGAAPPADDRDVIAGSPEDMAVPPVTGDDAAPADDPLTAASARLDGALTRYRREELDAEATRLGITIESGWNKPEVVEAIEKVYAEHPVRE